MGSRLAATLTIGQAPRGDMRSILEAHWPAQADAVHRGLLDGLSPADIAERFAPRPGEALLTTRLLDGSAVILGKPAVRQALQAAIDSLEDRGCGLIALLCTGEFEGLAARAAWLVEPDRVVPPVVAALAQSRQVGVVVPLAEQAATEAHKWQALARPPIYEVATPYAQGLDALAHAAQALQARGAKMLVLDCMGYTEGHRACAREASGLPVLLSNAVMARLLGELA